MAIFVVPTIVEWLCLTCLIHNKNIPSVQHLPDGTHDDAEGLNITPLLADGLSRVIRVDIDGEAPPPLPRTS